jgi:chorismate dehydratase
MFVKMFGFWNMRKLRISAISFLNTAPLMWEFENGTAAEDFEISYTVPSVCADALRSGAADIGIIPAAAFASIPDLVILPEIAIAAKGPVRSILLVSKVPIAQIRTVAADTSSRTSVALLHVLLERFWGGPREFKPMPPMLDAMLDCCDAALLIGDAALVVDRSRYLTWDLAEEWNRLTGKPFIFAFWAVRLRALPEMRPGLNLADVFRNSRDHGLQPQSLEKIATDWAPRLGLSEADIISYLTRNIDYNLNAENAEGLQLFYQWACECGALPINPALRFLGVQPLKTSLGC